MFFNNLTGRRGKQFSVITSKDLKKSNAPIEQRLKFESLQYQTPSRSKLKLLVNLLLLAAVLGGIIYLNVSGNLNNFKIQIGKDQLEKVKK